MELFKPKNKKNSSLLIESSIRLRKIFLLPSVLLLLLSGFWQSLLVVHASPPAILGYQGRLYDSSDNLEAGTFCLKFSIYDASSGGTKLWPSGSPSAQEVTVTNGVFNTGIGDTSAGGDALDFAFLDSNDYYLNVEIAEQVGGACTGGDESFETVSTRQQLYASAFAQSAQYVHSSAAEDTERARFSDTTNADSVSIYVGDGSPNGSLSAERGSIFLDQSGGFYVNTSGAGSGTTWTDIASGGSSSALSAITDATGDKTLSNGANNIAWNWQLTGAESALTIGESAASSGGSNDQYLLETSTLATSTAIPLYVQNLGAGRSFQVDDAASDTTPFVIDAAGNVGIGDPTPSALLSVGSGDLFTVNSSGAITAATGITSSGTITFSGLSDGFVKATSGVLSGGNNIDLTADVTGTLPVANGGTGATTLNDLITLGTHTTGNYLATLADAGSGFFTVSGSGSESAAVTLDLAADSIDFTELSDTLALDASTDIAIDGTEVFSLTNTGTANSFVVNDQGSDTTPFVIDETGDVGIGNSDPISTLDVYQPSSGTRGLLLSGNAVTAGGGTSDDGVLLSLGLNATGNRQLWLGDSARYGDSSYNSFRYIVGFDIPAIDAVNNDGTARRNISLGFTDTNVGVGLDITTAVQADVAAKLHIRGSGTTTGKALLVEDSAGTDKFTVLDNGNVGIGDLTPSAPLTVGNGDLFTVNSSGAITAAAGITSSGTITFSGLSDGIIKASSGVLSGGNSIDLTTDVTGTLPIANGGTGATTLNNLITLGTHTTGNYVATIADAGSSIFTVSGSGSETAAVTLDIVADSIGNTQLEYDTGQALTTSSSPTFANLTLATGGALRTSTSDTNTALLQAYDVDGASYTTFGTLTAGNTPTFDLSTSTTIGGNNFYYVGGTDVAVADGGTGASSLTDGGILFGNGTSAIGATSVLTNGQLLIGDGTEEPTLATLTGTSNQVSVSNGAGSITLSLPQDIATSSSPTFAGLTLANGETVTNGTDGRITFSSDTANADTLNLTPASGGGATFAGIITSADLSADRTWTLPNVTGSIVTTGDTGTVTNTMLAGSITASKLIGTDIDTVGTITTGVWNAGAVTSSGSLDVAGTIEAGSSNVTITTAAGNIDADAIGLISSDGAGSTSSGSGLETDTDRLGLLQGCSDNQILKWDEASSVWECAADSSGGGSGTLQDAYDNGATITTTDSKDIAFTLADTTTDSDLTVSVATGSTSTFSITRADGAGAADPSQLLLLHNADTDRAQPVGLNITSAGGGLTTAIDVSDADIGTALSAGANTIAITTGTIGSNAATIIDFAEFDVSGSTGAITIDDGGDAGSITIEGTVLDINSLDFTGAGTITTGGTFTLTPGGAVTLGDGGDTLEINTSDWDISTTGVITGVSFDADGTGNSISNVDLTSDVTGTLPIANGGTGATTLNDLITLGTHTTGNYLATLADAGNGFFTVSGSGSESAAVTLDLAADSIDLTELADTLTLDADLTFTAGAGEDITVNKTFTDATTENGVVLNFTASDTSSGTTAQYGLYLDNIASTEGLDALVVLDNSDTDDAVGTAIRFIDGGGGFTNLFNVAGTLISESEFTALDGGIDLASEITGTLPVANGGTGATSLTDGGILFGNGTSAIGATAVLTNGQLLIGDGTEEPTLATLTGTANQVSVSNGAGSITLSTPQDIDTSADVTFGSVTLANGESIANAVDGSVVLTDTGGQTLTFDLDASDPTLTTSTGGLLVTLGGAAGDDLNIDSDTFVIESDNDTVGIGISSPTAKFHVLNEGLTGGGSPQFATRSDVSIASGTQTAAIYGGYLSAKVDGTAVASGIAGSDPVGAIGFLDLQSTGTVTTGTGIRGMAFANSVGTLGTVTDAIGVDGLVMINSDVTTGGTITNAYALYGRNPIDIGAADITNSYGLYIQDQTTGSSDYGIAIEGADTQALWLSSAADNTDAANGIAFGSSRDTNLYRSAANTLKTDDGFVADSVTSAGTITFSGLTDGFVKATSGVLSGGNSIDLTADVTGTLPVANGGTGATTLNDLITLGTHTTGNYLATLADAGNGFFTVSGSGSESAAVTLDIAADSIDLTELADTLVLDADLAFTAGAGEEITLNKTYTDGTGENAFVLNFTGSDTGSGTSAQYGLYLDNQASTEGLDALVVLDNSDTDDAVGAAFKTVDAGGGFTNLFDIGGTLISESEFTVLDGGIDLTSDITGVLPIANGGTNKNLTLSAGGIAYFDADSFEVLSAGSSGQVLTSGGSGAPTWTTQGSGGGLDADTLDSLDSGSFLRSDTADIVTSGGITFNDDIALVLGTGSDTSFLWETADADAHYLSTVLSGSNNWIISADSGTDWTHADSTNPTLFIQSADEATVADYISFFHDQTNANIASGAGDIVLNPATGIVEGASALTLQAGGSNTNLTLKSAGTGNIIIQPGSDSTDAIELLNAAGSTLLRGDTTNLRIGITENNPDAPLHVTSSTSGTGATAIAGIKTELTINPSGGGFQFGNRSEVTVSNTSTATQAVGDFIRVTDSTSLANTVRGLEIQAYSGTNTLGTNTGLLAFGKTFGVQGVSTGLAGGVSEPAGVYGELQYTTNGNAIRAYSSQVTSSALVKFYQGTSTFTGQGLLMNFGKDSGGFTGDYLVLQENDTNRLTIDDTGQLKFFLDTADNTEAIYIDTEESDDSQDIFVIESDSVNNGQSADTIKARFEADGSLFVSLTGTQTSHALCHANNGQSNNDEIVDCNGTPAADYAELYPVASDVEYGDVLSASDTIVYTEDGDPIVQLVKSSTAYDARVIGVAVDNYSDFSLVGHNIAEEDNPLPVALVGRIPVRVSLENGSIEVGDPLTSSSVPGVAMKATKAGMIIGRALSSYDGEGEAGVMAFVNTGHYVPADQVNNNAVLAETEEAAFLVQQNGSGSLLQLQNNGIDNFLVHNDGTVAINTNIIDLEEKLVVVKNGDSEVFSINARGDALLGGLLIMPDDTFAGSVATNIEGQAHIVFSHHVGTGKPVVQLTPESSVAIFTQIVSFTTDNNNNYTGFILEARNQAGVPQPDIPVHYLVIGKQAGYDTTGSTGSQIIVVEEAEPIYDVAGSTQTGDVAGAEDDNTGETDDSTNDSTSESNDDPSVTEGDPTENNASEAAGSEQNAEEADDADPDVTDEGDIIDEDSPVVDPDVPEPENVGSNESEDSAETEESTEPEGEPGNDSDPETEPVVEEEPIDSGADSTEANDEPIAEPTSSPEPEPAPDPVVPEPAPEPVSETTTPAEPAEDSAPAGQSE